MRILAVLSGLDFKNSVRRATLEAIWRQHPDTDFLFYTGLKHARTEKKTIDGPSFYSYHFWVPEKLKPYKFLSGLEHKLRGSKWRAFFDQYDVIFMMDPNQFYLLNYLNHQKVVYLLRDPNILLSKKNFEKENKILQRSDLVLAISNELKNHYLPTYYDTFGEVKHWPNSVDLQIWDAKKYKHVEKYETPTVGISGNLTFKTDLKLLDKITLKLQHVNFVVIGKNKLNRKMNEQFRIILSRKNVNYKGFLPLEQVPDEVSKWHAGLMIERNDIEFSRYFNANKIYQYMAMGLPSVKYRYNNELKDMSYVVFEVNNVEDYLESMRLALKKSNDIRFRKMCIAKANENSADKRSEDFLEWVKALE